MSSCSFAPQLSHPFLLRRTGSVQNKIDRAESGESALQEGNSQNTRKEEPRRVHIISESDACGNECHGDSLMELAVSLQGVLKKSASGVLAPLSCSRTILYAPRAKVAAALLDGPF
jgi:hypothetical protein